MTGFLDAVSLLTRIPTHAGKDTRRAIPWMPVVGALVGLAVAGVYAGMRPLSTPIVAASIAVAAGIAVTGALHEDGLADVADAFGARVDRPRTIEILADPRHGTFGVLALIVSVVARVAAVASLSPMAAAFALPAAHALARGGALGTMTAFPAAEGSALGSAYRPTSIGGPLAGMAFACAMAGAAFGPWTPVALLLAATSGAVVGRLAVAKIGGFNGDVLGAVEQASEIGILIVAACLRATVPWWR